jgi:hypothetical protein
MKFLNMVKCTTLQFAIIIASTGLFSCQKVNDLVRGPELAPLEQGFKTSAAIGYCASLANSAFSGEALPANVSFNQSSSPGYTGAGIIHVNVTPATPLPFNHAAGDIYIAGLWDGANGGVISILFGDFDVFSSQFKFYGIHTVPVIKKINTATINTIFAQQDIIIGQGSDTILQLSLSKIKFDTELARLNNSYATDVFTAVTQNIWFVSIDPKGTPSDLNDDVFTVNGGGQIVEATSVSGGILYHAMIGTEFSYATCPSNPLVGTAFIQNLKASGSSVDLGNITLNFHNSCDGKALVVLATGNYFQSTGRSIDLNWN